MPAMEPLPAMDPAMDPIQSIIESQLRPHFDALARCRSTRALLAHPDFATIKPHIQRVLGAPEVGSFAKDGTPTARRSYRIAAWNLERGIHFEGQLAALRNHPYLRTCDALLLTETDSGMARSGNRHVARDLAAELGMHYAFAPCYLNLTKGAGLEFEVEGRNALGLHGSAILSRYPIRQARSIPLRNGIDKMRSREKRIGTQTALAADIAFPNLELTVAAIHLDAQSTQRHRQRQLSAVIDALPPGGPVLIGGDWNTTTYNSSHAFYAIMGFCLRVLIGVERTIRNHYLHPEHHFERGLFRALESRGFDWRSCNRVGEPTFAYDIADLKARKNLGEWVPGWCFACIRWALRNHGGKCPLKLDWFASRGLRCAEPMVIGDLESEHCGRLSDHDAIGVEVFAG
jgi:endonuclease/exonuclease/phosphatase family metal-dependent hydrolase